MDKLIATVFVKAACPSKDDLAAVVSDLTPARFNSEAVGSIGNVEVELRKNPDREDLGGPEDSWMYYPILIEFYSDSNEVLGDSEVEAIDTVLDALNSLGATYVTSSELEGKLASNGRNRPLHD